MATGAGPKLRFCPDCNDLLYAVEDKERKKLVYECRNCHSREDVPPSEWCAVPRQGRKGLSLQGGTRARWAHARLALVLPERLTDLRGRAGGRQLMGHHAGPPPPAGPTSESRALCRTLTHAAHTWSI